MNITGKDAPTTEETAEIVKLEEIIRAKDGKTKDAPSARPEDDPSASRPSYTES